MAGDKQRLIFCIRMLPRRLPSSSEIVLRHSVGQCQTDGDCHNCATAHIGLERLIGIPVAGCAHCSNEFYLTFPKLFSLMDSGSWLPDIYFSNVLPGGRA